MNRLKLLPVTLLGIGLLSNSHWAVAYTKVSNTDNTLAENAVLGNNANDWACTYDSNTQLIWEVKASDSGLRDQKWTYTWFNSDPKTNGGFDGGFPNRGTCVDKSNCDTEKFIKQVNAQGLCGAHDWRLPTINELKSLVNKAFRPAIDPNFFPNSAYATTHSVWYWSSTVWSPDTVHFAWAMDFEIEVVSYYTVKGSANAVRLVRDGKPSDNTVVVSTDVIAEYNPTTADLTITDVEVNGGHFWVQLHDLGGLKFGLQDYHAINTTAPSGSAHFDLNTHLLTLPKVKVGNQNYVASLLQQADGSFTILTVNAL